MDETCTRIIKSSKNMIQLCNGLNKVKDNKTRGTYFEYFAKLILILDPRYSNFVKRCWMLNEIPTKTMEYLEIPENDIGIDLVVKTKEKEYFAVQVKYRKNIDTEINWDSLSTFFGLTFGLTNKFKKGIFFTNTKNPNKYISTNENMIFILHYSLEDISENTFIKIRNYLNCCDNEEKIMYSPKPFQKKILDKTEKYFNDHKRGILYMACGTGKTLVGYWISERLKNNRVCVVVPSLYLLSQTYSKWVEMLETNYLLIGSDAEIKTCNDTGLLLTTKSDEIETYLRKHAEVVVITTYQSSDIFADVCKKIDYKFDFTIFDEAHKTVGSLERQFSYLLDNNNFISEKRLFMTATERVYKHVDEEDILSMDNKFIYGKVICDYNFKQAIEEDQLCDYQIIVPLINDSGFNKIVQKNKYVIDNEIDNMTIDSRYYMTCILICQAIREHHLTHILTFNNTNENAKKINKVLCKMIKQMEMECNCYYLTGENTMKHRRKVVDEFIKDECAIINSARIFQEGVDIPIVDCICFVDNKLSKIDIIQSIGRVLRKHPNKEIGYILVPTLIDFKNNDDNVYELNKEDFVTVKNILKAIGTSDERIIDEFIRKDVKNFSKGTKKFLMETKNIFIDGIELNVIDIVGKISGIICDRWGCVGWNKNLEKVKTYIEENNKRPSSTSKNTEIKQMGTWIQHQLNNYDKKQQIMSNKEFRKKWKEFVGEYDKYFKSNDDIWDQNLEKVKTYIGENNERPSNHSKNTETKQMGNWIKT